MASFARFLPLLTLLALNRVSDVSAQCTENVCGEVPLYDKHYTFPDVPYRVDTEDHLARGGQTGYNICNSTTEGPESMCQTSHFNSLDDFCLWAPPIQGKEVGEIEGEMVAWCSKPGHGSRIVPEGTFSGLQWINTPDYVQLAGFLDQTKVNLVEGDYGGEMDPFGLDLRGNPIGGLVFSSAFGDRRPAQIIRWHLFIGGNQFCMKVCDPAGPNAHLYCENKYDRIGCAYNAPNNAQDGTFEICDGDNMDFVGTYTQDGQVMTYTQPHDGPATVPYTARIPASSNCVPQASAELFNGQPATTPVPTSVASSSRASSSSSAAASSATASRSSGGSSSSRLSTVKPSNSGASNSGSSSPASTGQPEDTPGNGFRVGVSAVSIFGAIMATLVLA
ncbi:macrophage activating glycoprotein [Coprinopsis sp. MPI-PUGE-AT-0042]|nr:macrophage activating glycoprotein [Coprinopsis sp. MPI-PUGE-AT-0042]